MWRSRIFWRLFGTYSVLLAISLGFLGWTIVRRMEAHLLADMRQSLEMKTALVRELVVGQNLSQFERQQQVNRLAEETQSRITLVAADGLVLADSAEAPQRMDSHADRPEIQEAAASGMGTSTRYSDTVHQPMMYVARKLEAGDVRYVRIAVPLRAVDEQVRWLQQAVWTAAGATLVVALVISLLLARRMTGPLVELADVAHSMAQGFYGQRALLPSRGEIGTLAKAFNEMSQACADHIAQMDQDRQQLRAVFASMAEGVIVVDADQRLQFFNEAAGRLLNLTPELAQGKKLWQVVRHRQLAEALDTILSSDEPHRCELEWGGAEPKVLAVHGSRLPGTPIQGAVLVLHDMTPLRRLERVRQDFVANVSHELKTPLAAIQATTETLLDGALGDPAHNVGFLRRIRENADRLHRLVQDLLTLGRIESGRETMELQPIAVQEAVHACLTRHGPRATAKELNLEQSPPGEPATVLADDEALAEILDNLVDNAIKYTPAHGRITLRWFEDDHKVVVEVEDTGVGIPEKDLPRVFERFYRVDKARSRELGGTGLGLSIVKHLVQTLQGSISATSRIGEGSTFTLRLPRADGGGAHP